MRKERPLSIECPTPSQPLEEAPAPGPSRPPVDLPKALRVAEELLQAIKNAGASGEKLSIQTAPPPPPPPPPRHAAAYPQTPLTLLSSVFLCPLTSPCFLPLSSSFSVSSFPSPISLAMPSFRYILFHSSESVMASSSMVGLPNRLTYKLRANKSTISRLCMPHTAHTGRHPLINTVVRIWSRYTNEPQIQHKRTVFQGLAQQVLASSSATPADTLHRSVPYPDNPSLTKPAC